MASASAFATSTASPGGNPRKDEKAEVSPRYQFGPPGFWRLGLRVLAKQEQCLWSGTKRVRDEWHHGSEEHDYKSRRQDEREVYGVYRQRGGQRHDLHRKEGGAA